MDTSLESVFLGLSFYVLIILKHSTKVEIIFRGGMVLYHWLYLFSLYICFGLGLISLIQVVVSYICFLYPYVSGSWFWNNHHLLIKTFPLSTRSQSKVGIKIFINSKPITGNMKNVLVLIVLMYLERFHPQSCYKWNIRPPQSLRSLRSLVHRRNIPLIVVLSQRSSVQGCHELYQW